MDEARGHVGRGEIGEPFDHLVEQDRRGLVAPRRVRGRQRPGELCEAIGDQLLHLALQLMRGEPLERADPDMAVAEPHQHRRAGRRRLVAAHQLLAGLDHREGL